MVNVKDIDLLKNLVAARTSFDVEAILTSLPVVPVEEYHWTSDSERYGEWQQGKLHWIPVGRSRGNAGRISLAGEPFNPIAERLVNGMEALIELKRLAEIVQEPHRKQPSSPRDAVMRYFGLPKLDVLEAYADEERKKLRNIASQLQKQLQVHLDQDKSSKQFAVTIRDFGIGQTPNDVSETLLSLGQSGKPDKPYLIGLFGQGGSSAYSASEYSVVVSRRAEELRNTDEDGMIGWSIVRRVYPDERRDPYFAYLAIDESGRVPRVLASESHDEVEFDCGTHFCHIDYDFGGIKSEVSRQLYQALNHVLFNPVFPYELYAMKDTPDPMRGTAQRLARQTKKASRSESVDKSFSDLTVESI